MAVGLRGRCREPVPASNGEDHTSTNIDTPTRHSFFLVHGIRIRQDAHCGACAFALTRVGLFVAQCLNRIET